jgi:hypothetical protein
MLADRPAIVGCRDVSQVGDQIELRQVRLWLHFAKITTVGRIRPQKPLQHRAG